MPKTFCVVGHDARQQAAARHQISPRLRHGVTVRTDLAHAHTGGIGSRQTVQGRQQAHLAHKRLAQLPLPVHRLYRGENSDGHIQSQRLVQPRQSIG